MSDFLNSIIEKNPVTIILNKLFEKSKLLSGIANYFEELFFYNASYQAYRIFFGLGLTAITFKLVHSFYSIYQTWKWVPSHIKNRKNVTQQNLKNKYGDCYVVVTGCTEGIGYAYATQMARLGFGIVFVARNKQKVQRRANQIKNICPNLKYEVVIGDLTNVKDIKRVAQQLGQLAKRIDIGIVVNNAGLSTQKFMNFIKQDTKGVTNILNINFLTIYQINSIMIPILRTRKYRSAIINLSSGFGHFISHGTSTYTHSKVMVDHYSRTLAIENKDKLDIITVRPFGVRTPMMEMKKGAFMISPKDCVISSLADLGQSDTTWTGFMHKVQASYLAKMKEQQIFALYDKIFQTRK